MFGSQEKSGPRPHRGTVLNIIHFTRTRVAYSVNVFQTGCSNGYTHLSFHRGGVSVHAWIRLVFHGEPNDIYIICGSRPSYTRTVCSVLLLLRYNRCSGDRVEEGRARGYDECGRLKGCHDIPPGIWRNHFCFLLLYFHHVRKQDHDIYLYILGFLYRITVFFSIIWFFRFLFLVCVFIFVYIIQNRDRSRN